MEWYISSQLVSIVVISLADDSELSVVLRSKTLKLAASDFGSKFAVPADFLTSECSLPTKDLPMLLPRKQLGESFTTSGLSDARDAQIMAVLISAEDQRAVSAFVHVKSTDTVDR